MSAVHLGVYVNNRSAVFLGDEYTLSDLVDMARLAEEYAFDYVAVGDSLLAKPRYSPLVTLAGIAAVTERIGLTTGILQPHMRNPVLLAQESATLDHLAGGRTSFGLGLGTGPKELVEKEYELVGYPKRHRGTAFDEAIQLLRRLWTEAEVSFHGEVFALDSVTAGYGPFADPHPPLLVACGGYVPKQPGMGPNDFYSPERADTFGGPFERVARLGDGWITGIATPEEIRDTWDHIHACAAARGRILEPGFHVRLNTFVNVGDESSRARRDGVEFLSAYHRLPFDADTVDRWLIAGSPQQCAERIATYAEHGVTSFQLVPASSSQQEQLRLLAEEVRPRLRQAGVDAPVANR